MKKQLFRQGDVLIERIAEIPKSAKRRKDTVGGRIILAHGEATGHHHSIDMRDADWWKAPNEAPGKDQLAQEQFINVKRPTQLEHQEHAPISLQPGKYRVTRQREYSPEAIRNVAD